MTTDHMDQIPPPGQEQEIATATVPGGAPAPRTRRHVLTMALGGAGTLALAVSGTLALRRAAANDDEDDEDDGGGDEGDEGDDDTSGSGSGGDHGGGDHGGDDDDEADADDREEDDDGGDDDDAAVGAGSSAVGVTEVRITDDDADAFQPQSITVEIGTEVTFVNNDDEDHTATGGGFDAGVLAPGDSGTVTLSEPGEQFYSCVIHPEMTGTITVRDAGGGTPGATPAATPRVIEAEGGNAGAAGAETVAIANFAFEPDGLTVSVGTTVTWENVDEAPHTATAEDGSFDTGRIDTGGNAGVTFDEPGTFAYVCLFHPNMQATITVE